jgi:hypothetical protein
MAVYEREDKAMLGTGFKRLVRGLLWLMACLAPAVCAAQSAGTAAPARYALVIGNARYAEAPLANPVNDARAVAARLKTLGFRVWSIENANLVTMRTAVAQFGQRLLEQPDAAALFYFAGHGMQSRGANYLIPVDAKADSEATARPWRCNWVTCSMSCSTEARASIW